MLNTQTSKVFIAVVYIVSNLCLQSIEARNALLQFSILGTILRCSDSFEDDELNASICWFCSNLLRGTNDQEYPSFDLAAKVFEQLARLLPTVKNSTSLREIGWGMHSFVDAGESRTDRIRLFIQGNLIPAISELLSNAYIVVKTQFPFIATLNALSDILEINSVLLESMSTDDFLQVRYS